MRYRMGKIRKPWPMVLFCSEWKTFGRQINTWNEMKKIAVLSLLILGTVFKMLAAIPERPIPPRLVNDFAGFLRAEQVLELENTLEYFARTTSTQIVVVIVPDLHGYDPADYAFRLGENWGVGQKGKDNGIVVLLKPKTKDSKGQVFVATGYGLEGVLPDAIINRDVVDYEMIPRFKEGDYFGGLTAGLNVIMDIVKGEYTAEQYHEQVSNGRGGASVFGFLLFVALFVFIGRSRSRYYTAGSSLPFWLAMGLFSGGSHRSSGMWNDFSSGGGSFGGGFGGFGGGSFGGGGAGGSW